MSAVMAIQIENLETSPNNYRMVSFPNRVKIESISFCINFDAAGLLENERVWKLYAAVGTPRPNPENGLAEDVRPLIGIFGEQEKPVVTVAQTGLLSTVAVPASIITSSGDKTQTRSNVILHEGVLNAGEYIALWIELQEGDVEEIDYSLTSAVISISYKETTDLSLPELVQLYPNLD